MIRPIKRAAAPPLRRRSADGSETSSVFRRKRCDVRGGVLKKDVTTFDLRKTNFLGSDPAHSSGQIKTPPPPLGFGLRTSIGSRDADHYQEVLVAAPASAAAS